MAHMCPPKRAPPRLSRASHSSHPTHSSRTSRTEPQVGTVLHQQTPTVNGKPPPPRTTIRFDDVKLLAGEDLQNAPPQMAEGTAACTSKCAPGVHGTPQDSNVDGMEPHIETLVPHESKNTYPTCRFPSQIERMNNQRLAQANSDRPQTPAPLQRLPSKQAGLPDVENFPTTPVSDPIVDFTRSNSKSPPPPLPSNLAGCLDLPDGENFPTTPVSDPIVESTHPSSKAPPPSLPSKQAGLTDVGNFPNTPVSDPIAKSTCSSSEAPPPRLPWKQAGLPYGENLPTTPVSDPIANSTCSSSKAPPPCLPSKQAGLTDVGNLPTTPVSDTIANSTRSTSKASTNGGNQPLYAKNVVHGIDSNDYALPCQNSTFSSQQGTPSKSECVLQDDASVRQEMQPLHFRPEPPLLSAQDGVSSGIATGFSPVVPNPNPNPNPNQRPGSGCPPARVLVNRKLTPLGAEPDSQESLIDARYPPVTKVEVKAKEMAPKLKYVFPDLHDAPSVRSSKAPDELAIPVAPKSQPPCRSSVQVDMRFGVTRPNKPPPPLPADVQVAESAPPDKPGQPRPPDAQVAESATPPDKPAPPLPSDVEVIKSAARPKKPAPSRSTSAQVAASDVRLPTSAQVSAASDAEHSSAPGDAEQAARHKTESNSTRAGYVSCHSDSRQTGTDLYNAIYPAFFNVLDKPSVDAYERLILVTPTCWKPFLQTYCDRLANPLRPSFPAPSVGRMEQRGERSHGRRHTPKRERGKGVATSVVASTPDESPVKTEEKDCQNPKKNEEETPEKEETPEDAKAGAKSDTEAGAKSEKERRDSMEEFLATL